MATAQSERRKYEAVWTHRKYRQQSPGERVLPEAMEWIKPEPGATFCDYGAGTCRATLALDAAGFPCTAVDIAANCADVPPPRFVQACLWQLPPSLPRFDHGFCVDVMEHIPTQYVQRVLRGIAQHTGKSAFFQIALVPDKMGALVGEPLHLTVRPAAWWGERLRQAFRAVAIRDHGDHVLALAEA